MRHRITLDQLPTLLRKLEPEMRAAIRRGLKSATLRAKHIVIEEIDKASPYPAVDTGGLRNSVKTDLRGPAVIVDAPHAAPINNGTRPFWPPLAPLLTWVIRKGLADDEDDAEQIARAIQFKIAREGIAPRFFMEKAMARVRNDIIPAEIRAELLALEARGIV
jgi:hypothetical protein